MTLWQTLGVIGSLAVTGPIGVAIALWLLAGRSWRLTLAWAALFSVGMGLVVLTKVAFLGWGVGVASVEFAGFSGHAMRAAAVFPVAAFLAFRSSGDVAQRLALLAGVVLAVLIAVSRVYSGAHSVSESVTGCLLGLAVAAAFVWQASAAQHMALSRVLVVLCIPVLLVAPRVEPVPTEEWMERLAMYLSGRDQPYTRQIWQAQSGHTILVRQLPVRPRAY
jgi:membrane-associated phospholipid phosphatase